MKKLLLLILDCIYKRKCYFCRNSKDNAKMCSACFGKIEFNNTSYSRTIDNIPIYCATEYKDIVQKLIRGVKYHNQKELAFYQAKIMFNYWKNLNINKDFQVIPVPMHINRKKKRKYNHTELVAEEFCKMTGYKLNTKLIDRIRDTKPQYKLNKKERLNNLKNAFKINKEFLLDKPIILLDDICTTGATFESIIKELNNSKIYDIIGFTTATPNFSQD